jgi:N-acetylmuramoyl-L-alanine amidase
MGGEIMGRVWRLVAIVALVLAGSVTPAMAKGKPGGPGSGGSCPTGTADVVLDPGHGGGDPGAMNAEYGLRESDVALDIAYQTAAILEGNGLTVALTRYDDTGLGNSDRGAIANACGAAVFVEIHLNASSDPSVDFTQTFWGKKRKDLAFSDVIYASLEGSLGIPGNGVGQFANGGLLHAEMPATLVETVFITNPDEAAALAAGSRQPEIASAIAGGTLAWLF